MLPGERATPNSNHIPDGTKLASDYRKPDGLYVITPKMGAQFVENLPVGKFHGIGPATTAKMNGFGIHTGADLRAQSLEFLQRNFGKSGPYYYWISRGIDERPVRADRNHIPDGTKLASDYRKPDGLYVITPKMGAQFVENLPVGKFHGIGPATTAKMNGFGIHTGADLRAQSLEFLQRNFGKSGPYYYWISRGIDECPVRADRVRKSIGAENTFVADLIALGEAREALMPIIDKVWRHCEATGTRGRTVTLKVKYANFHQITRSTTVAEALATKAELEQLSGALLEPVFPVRQGIRLLGVTLSALGGGASQGDEQLRLSL